MAAVTICSDFEAQMVGKESACNAADPGLIPGSERSPREGIHSGILAWRIPRIEEPMGYSPRGRKELDVTKQLTLVYVLGLSNSNTDQSH